MSNTSAIEPDLEIDPTEELEVDEATVRRFQIAYYPSDLTLKGYLDKWEAEQLLVPDFQRQYVWELGQASRLIESFLLGIPVPGVFLYKQRKTNKLLVIDGLQRIMTAIQYFQGKFKHNDEAFRLKRVFPAWEGRTFDQLQESDQLQLQDSVLRATIIQQLDPQDDTSIYQIFERLNTGGTNLSPMEIRKCLYTGQWFTLLEDLNQDENWRQLIGKAKPDKRLGDVELVLRVVALRQDWANYEKPMKEFLNLFLSHKRELTAEEAASQIRDIARSFKETAAYVHEALGPKPFHLRGRLNLGLMDSVLVAMSHGKREDAASQFELLKADETYVDWVTRNTSDASVIKNRFARAGSALMPVPTA